MKLADRLRPAGPVDPAHTFRRVIEGGFFTRYKRVLAGVWLVGILGAAAGVVVAEQLTKPEPMVAALPIAPISRPWVAGVDPLDRPLSKAPLAALQEEAAEGKLPIVDARTGNMPVVAYSFPFDRADPHPRIAIILVDVGLQADQLRRAVGKLSGAVGLAFSAYTDKLDQAVNDARKAGHETWLSLPTESVDASIDAGNGALRPSLTIEDNIQRMRLIFGKASGYVGAVLPPSSAVPANLNGLKNAMITEMAKRGLGFAVLNPELAVLGRAQGAPTVDIVQQLDRDLSPQGITQSFFELEQRARETGQALAITPLYPVMVDRLAEWLPTLADRGIALAPASALVALPDKPAIAAPAAEGHDPHVAAAHGSDHAEKSSSSHEAPATGHGGGH